MIIEFEYERPKTLAQTIKVLSRFKNKACILAGGTDLVGFLKENQLSPKIVVDIKNLKELKKIEFKNNFLSLGALVTFADILESSLVKKKLPVLQDVAHTVASVGIRNRATLVGNICSAVPCLDSGPILVALDAIIELKGPRGIKKVSASKWFLGPRKVAKKADELVIGVKIPVPKGPSAGSYFKLGRYQGEDLAQASVFTFMYLNDKKETYRVAFGSVGPTPIRALKIENLLNNNEDAIAQISKTVSPITDIRASKEYRLHMCEVMFKRSLELTKERFFAYKK